MLAFQRSISLIDKKYMLSVYGQKFSLFKLNAFKLRKLYKLEDKNLVEKYLFWLLNQWVQANYEETLSFAHKLKKIIRKLKLKLNFLEKEQLLILEERIFSLDRHIKKLSVNLILKAKEDVGAKFLEAKLLVKSNLKAIGTLLITNQRVLFFNDQRQFSFPYTISKITCSSAGMSVTKLKQEFIIQIHDQITLANTFANIYHRKVKKH